MRHPVIPPKRFVRPPSCEGSFKVSVNKQPLLVSSLLGRLTLRPELSQAPSHWIWKIIADGKVGHKRTSIGLFFDKDLEPGTYDLPGNERIKVVYNESPHWQSVIYHSAHFQAGAFTLIEADPQSQRLQGVFSFSISAVDFEVTDGSFDVYCK
ncbi:hypothetical protein PSCICO_43700 [Pseudomonas cichorii]|uniref:Uncharacterized protein n=1 Tax=Pseudomonas serbiensis TaxID=3064350 RepID=A0ABT9CWN3_9PSED|nr:MULTISPECIES: hypothetical protein [Pseudomonas]MDO7929860.1 hypothetical protein [Pseudomonas sp. KFB-138]GFM88971.1 hypothetical protein PSCICO_43700 [Pseudomonas cichorii]